MKTPFGQLTYCSNIHTGEEWQQHFSVLRDNIPAIKANSAPDAAMGIGLRLANKASIDLTEPNNLDNFKQWLIENDCYVFTMNGFPYGGFHDVVVKDQVHAPDWTSTERVDYTIRMFHLLAKLLPDHLQEGGISTSPLSYRFWWKTPTSLSEATVIATKNMLLVVDELLVIAQQTGKILHLDIEPEPDGILENSVEFIEWYQQVLLPLAIEHFAKKSIEAHQVYEIIHTHIQLCYDVCHFGVSYEEPKTVIEQLNALGIRVGKIQISSALKVDFSTDAQAKLSALAQYNEPTYLHQVVAKLKDGNFEKFPDLTEAINQFEDGKYSQWRVHFHVPLFLENYGLLSSTQSEIIKTLTLQKEQPFTKHLEIETYTWGVLPSAFQAPLNESISREIAWVKQLLWS
jgi:hypothetical protein